jgi:hypothetical protein
MDYQKHYDRLVDRAKSRILDGYSETHHVIPRCIGGGDDPGNLVALTKKEHMIAHQLLVKIYPEHIGISFGALMMSTRVSDKRYEWLRRDFAKKITIVDRTGWKTTEKRSEEHKRKIAESVRKAWANPEIRKKQVEAMRSVKRTISDEQRAKLSLARKGKKLSEEHKKKISLSNSGKKRKITTIVCPHCGKSGRRTNIKRYHFDYCKSRTDNHTN